MTSCMPRKRKRRLEMAVSRKADCIVTRNVISGSGNLGLFLNATAGYGYNMVLKPGTGAGTVSGGLNLGGNRCLSGTTQTACP